MTADSRSDRKRGLARDDKIIFRIDPMQARALKKHCKKEELKRSQVMRLALKQYFLARGLTTAAAACSRAD